MVPGTAPAIRGAGPERERLFDYNVYLEQAHVFHARYLSAAEERGLLRYGYVREVDLDLCIGNPEIVLQFQQLRALDTVHTLTINKLDLHKFFSIFDRTFSQFVPTVRSLSLKAARCENAHQFMEFVCRFPHLDDLVLISPRGPDDTELAGVPPGLELPRPLQPLPFRGHLALTGTGRLVPCLLDLPGGIRFHSIEVSIDTKYLAKLLAACLPTLEVLSIHCFESCKCGTFRVRVSSLKGHRSLASHSLRGEASGSFRRLAIRGEAQYQPGVQRDPQTIRACCRLCRA